MKRLAVLLVLHVALAVLQLASAAVEAYFLRHGETAWNRAKILQGSIPYTDITPKGVRMTQATAEGMSAAGIRFGRIYTSPYLRARHTAEIIAAGLGGSAPIADDRLREMCFGRYEGIRYAPGAYPDENLRRFFEEPEAYVPSGDGAESFDAVGARVRAFLEKELKPLDGTVERVLCVTHSLVLKSLIREIAGDQAPAAAKQPIQRNCCVHVLRYEDGRFSLKETGRIFYPLERFAAVEPRMVAHRGAGDLEMPEASRPAYSNAVTAVSDIVKLDLQCTKDGVIVMGHDPTLKRNMGWDVKISDLTYAEILEKGRFLENGRPGNERIVRLDEALAIVKPAPEFWIDFKHFDPTFAEKVVAAFSAAGIDLSRVMMATFSKAALKYFQTNHPSIRRVGHYSIKKDKLTDDRRPMLDAVLQMRDQYGLFGVNMPVLSRQTRPEDVAFLQKNGLWVSLWFVQKADAAEIYRPSGADAFVTDHASAVRLKW